MLNDGETAFIRPITPDDAPLLLAFHEHQPRENLYRRFFSPKPTLSTAELEHFTMIDFADRVALVMEQRGEFIAWASYERLTGRDDADVAFMVDADQQGKGIATLLLEHLAAIARDNGIERFTADVLSDNRPMLRVFSRAGWPVERHFDSGVTELEFPLSDTEHFVDSVEEREHRADSRAVAKLLLPRSIAIIGASDREGSIGCQLWRNAVDSFSGPVYPVNPAKPTVGGKLSYTTVTDIDGDISLAVVAVPPDDLVATIEACILKRVRGAIIVTATDGTDVDVPALVAHARRNGLRIIGPASMGIASSHHGGGIRASLVDVRLPAGGVAISMQSASLGASLLQLAAQMSVGLSWFVSLGDKDDISGNDLLQFWEDDENTTVIAMYTETFGNPRKFARIARRVGRRKPIVAVRTGAAAIGSASDALYRQAGLIEVPTVRALLDTARVLATQPIPAGPRVAVLTNARSPGVLAAAAVTAAGLTLVDAPRPLDWRSKPSDFADALSSAIAADGVDAVLVVHAPPIASAPAPIDEIEAAAAGSPKPVVTVLLGHSDGPLCPGSRVPNFSFPEPAAAVLGWMSSYHKWRSTEAEQSVEPLEGVDAGIVALIIEGALARGERLLSLAESALALQAYGVDTPDAVYVADALDEAGAEAVVAVAATVGYPVTLKSSARRVGRSAEAGIALDLADGDAVRHALDIMRESLGADTAPLIVQRMVAPGVDVHLRCSTDPRLGPVVTIGLGSLQADSVGGDASRLAPVSRAGATGMIDASLVGTALKTATIDADRLIDVIRRVGQLVFDHPQIVDIDIDPAIVSASGCRPTDVHISIQPEAAIAQPLRRLV